MLYIFWKLSFQPIIWAIKKEVLSILRGVRFLLTQWDAYVNSILQCVLWSYGKYRNTHRAREWRKIFCIRTRNRTAKSISGKSNIYVLETKIHAIDVVLVLVWDFSWEAMIADGEASCLGICKDCKNSCKVRLLKMAPTSQHSERFHLKKKNLNSEVIGICSKLCWERPSLTPPLA